MMSALGHWAARHGARYAYVQVATINEPAIAAYRRLGFVPHHSYLYLAPARYARDAFPGTQPPLGF
jgi:N-acetylglutamate synthase